MKIAHKKFIAAAILSLCIVFPLNAAEPALRLANSYGKSMVLQRDIPAPVWGWASAEAEVSVTFKGQSKSARADADGRWRVVFDPMPADAAPGVLTASCAAMTVKVEDVLVGDVWLCAGPGVMRNMGALQDSKHEIATVKFPQVRILRPDTYISIVPVADIPAPAEWTAASPESIEKYSVTWYVGRELHLASGVPVGIVLANMATDLPQDWLAWRYDPADKAQAQALRVLAEQMPHDIARTEEWLCRMRKRPPGDPIDLLLFPTYIPYAFYTRHPIFDKTYPVSYRRSSVFNSLVGPFVPMAIRGVILNSEFESKHGEAATGSIKEIVESWRAAWGRPGLPFVISGPLGKAERAGNERKGREAVAKAVSNAGALPNVSVVPTPQAFSDRTSEDYWKTVAAAAMKLPREEISPMLPMAAWAQPSLVKMDAPPTRGRLEAAHLFADNMVLQCDQPLKVWGWSEPGEAVSVSFADQHKETLADQGGRWQVTLDAMKPGDSPMKMTIKGQTETLTFENALVGEVWINSGQSNSGYVLSATLDFAQEQPLAKYPAIRYFANARAADVLPQRRNMGNWVVVSPETAGHLSGMAYYFARAIHKDRRVPVGIIECNHGGSTILSWMSDAALASSPKFAALAADRAAVRDEMLANLPVVEEAVSLWAADARRNALLARPVLPFPVDASPIRPFYGSFLQNPMNRRGSMFYNAMIYSMAGYGVRGAIWNQGEADAGTDRTAFYDDLMAAMVADWRKSWGQEFSFYYVQMPARKGDGPLCNMWDVQARALTKISHSGMIVCNDISEPGTPHEVHPRDKKNVGERLARLALVRTYGVKGMIDASPMMQSVTRDGNRVVVTFSTPGEGLKTRDGKPSDSWEIAGSDGKYVSATAEISGTTVTLVAAGVTAPVSVRLGWKSDSNCNLVNSDGLPAMPFTAAVSETRK